jgi:predicted O-methyltransferase YrrM
MSFRTKLANAFWRVGCAQLRESFAIASHLTHRERVELFRLAQAPGLKSIVEIGSYLGASAAAFGAGLRQSSNGAARIYCIDTWNNDAMSEGQRETMSGFLDNTVAFQKQIVPLRGLSTAMAPEIRRQMTHIDLLFIDGDHSYPGCLADWRAYRDFLRPRSRIVLHDVGWAEGVQRVLDEEIRSHVRTESRLPNLWWGELA